MESVISGEDQEIGRVASVTGSRIVIVVEDGSERNTAPARELQKGALVKIINGRSSIFGLVTTVSKPFITTVESGDGVTLAELALLGEIEEPKDGESHVTFQRGVSYYPVVGESVFAASQDDLSIVYARPEKSSVRIGTIHQDQSIPAYIAPDNTLGKHFAILGATGSGKSCATALILRRILEKNPNAHVLLLDPHNEYVTAFPDMSEFIDAHTLQLPMWLFSLEELSAAILGVQDYNAETIQAVEILSDIVTKAKIEFGSKSGENTHISVDTPVPFRVSDLIKILDEEMGRMDKARNLAPYILIKSRIENLQSNSRYDFMFGGISIYDNFLKILSRLFRVPVDDKPISVLDLSTVPSEILNIVVSVICRITFDFAYFSEGKVPVLLVCEEAHRYLPEDARLGFGPTKRILSRIAKEGRKYGVSLCIVSQRPSDLAISALSQCNTIFALRLMSQTDQAFVQGAMPHWGDGLLDFLPSLRNAEAIVVGEGISVPARIQFDTLSPEHLPRRSTAPFSTAWQEDLGDSALIEGVIAKWRSER